MSPHDEDQEECLNCPNELPTPWAKENFTSIGHAVDLWMPQLELTQDLASVYRETSKP